MTDKERTEHRINEVADYSKEYKLDDKKVFDVMICVALPDIMRSLASIADSLEIIAARKDDQNEDSVQG